MKAIAVVLAAFSASSSAAWAAAPVQAEAKDIVTARVGISQPLEKVEGQGTELNGSSGMVFGADYIRKVRPRLGLGLEYSYVQRQGRDSAALVSGALSKVSGEDHLILAMAKWFILPQGQFQPYLGAGVGVGISRLKVVSEPAVGFPWTATGTTDNKTIVDSTDAGFAFGLRGGADAALTKDLSLGVELGYTRVGGLNYPLTEPGKQVLPGLSSFKAASGSYHFAGRLVYRFRIE